ncbi:MAG: hypothetical protein U0325_20365 [Polyangiales bacterium]
MRARRTSAPSAVAEEWSDSFETAPDDDFAPKPPAGPVTLCLACGAEPLRGECPHDEVVTLDAPGAGLLAAARTLARLTHERRAAERALRRQVEAEVLRGEGQVELTRREPPPPPTLPVAGTRPRRRRGAPEGQGAFAFAEAAVEQVAGEIPPR